MEALSVTGPAKNLFAFIRQSREMANPVDHQIVTFRRPGQPEHDEFIDGVKAAGAECRIIVEKSAGDLSVVESMRKVAAQFQPDILQTHNNKSHFLMRWSDLNKRLPWVAFHHGYTWVSQRQRLYNLLDRWSLRQAHRVVVVTTAFEHEMRRAGVRTGLVRIVPNAIHTSGRREHRGLADIPLILSVGRLSKEKGHEVLLEAVGRLQRKCRVRFVGEGPERSQLEAQSKRLGLSVEFTGQISRVGPHYEEADLFVMPSYSEGSPNALLEAMAAELAIVATRVGGIPETARDQKEALLVEAGSPDEMAKAIENIMAAPALARRLGQAARDRVEAEFSIAARAEKLISIYKEVLRECKSS